MIRMMAGSNFENKKILVISPFNIFPPYWGGANRIYNLVKHLANENKVTLLCNNLKQLENENIDCNVDQLVSSNPNIKLHFVKSLGKFSQIFNPLLIIESLKIIRNEKTDVIIAEFTWSGLHAILLRLLTGTPYILDEHNVEFLRFKRMQRGNRLAVFFLKMYERVSCRYASNVYCVSEVDKMFLHSELHVDTNKIIIVPNMVDVSKFLPNTEKREIIRTKMGIDNNTPFILFFGKLDYKPNLEAVEIIHNRILQRVLDYIPNAKFVIVGDNPPIAFIHESIIYTGLVEHIEHYINASDVVICPLISGGGTRIKILESLACGKTVISTSIGAEGIVENNSEKLKIVDDWIEFVHEIVASISRKNNSFNKNCTYSWEKDHQQSGGI